MINAINATLDCSPQRFHRIDVDNAVNVLFGGMLHDFMGIANSFNMIVARQFISIDHCFVRLLNIPFNHGEQGSSLNIWDYSSDSVPLTFYHAHNDCLTTCTTTTSTMRLATNVSLVNFNLSRERINIIGHKFADFFKHTPRCFVGNAKFPLKLFSGDTSFSRGH